MYWLDMVDKELYKMSPGIFSCSNWLDEATIKR